MEQLVFDRETAIRFDKVSGMARDLLGLPHDLDNPPPAGPMDPVIRWLMAGAAFGPVPDPWRPSLGDLLGPVALNPQPLPPLPARTALVAAIARAAVARAELVGEAAEAAGRGGLGAQRLGEMLEWWCGTPPQPFPWPFPWPRPEWLKAAIGPADHVVFAATLESALAGGLAGEIGEAARAAQPLLERAVMATLEG